MGNGVTVIPDSTAVRVALCRALHVRNDPPPHVLEDEIGPELLAPDESWKNRPDMDPQGTQPFRASIVARARFIEHLVTEQAGQGVANTFCLALASTVSLNVDPGSAPSSGCLKLTSPGRKHGSGNA